MPVLYILFVFALRGANKHSSPALTVLAINPYKIYMSHSLNNRCCGGISVSAVGIFCNVLLSAAPRGGIFAPKKRTGTARKTKKLKILPKSFEQRLTNHNLNNMKQRLLILTRCLRHEYDGRKPIFTCNSEKNEYN